MTPLLHVTGLTTGYSRAPILRDVGLSVAAGELIAVLGANGAGKTTLLRAVSGTLPAWKGTISVEGRDVTRAPAWSRVRAGLAHVPEGRHVFGALTVDENLTAASLVVRGRVSRDTVFELFPRLAERRAQRAGSLSGGEQQMLAIARALLTDPKVLLVDEMSAGLSPLLAQQLVDGLVRVHVAGVAVVLVEQSPTLIADVVERVCLLEHGAIVAEDTLEALGGADALGDLYLGLSRAG